MRERPQPIKQGPNVGAIVFVLILIAGAAFAGWWFFMRPLPPEQVVQKFMEAAKANDVEKVKPFLSKDSLDLLEQQRKMTGQTNMNMGGLTEDVEIGATKYEGTDKSIALVPIGPKDKSKIQPGQPSSIDLVLLKEEGKWKIDLKETMNRVMKMVFEEMRKKGYGPPPGGRFPR